MNPYQYSPLQKDRNEFRLVRLQPGPEIAEIKIEIFHAARTATYEALSYAWGDPERTEFAIVCASTEKIQTSPLSKLAAYLKPSARNNEPSVPLTTIGLTHNLAVALRHLRYRRFSRVLWIDAICIYADRYQRKYYRNLRFGPLFSEGFRSASRINIPPLSAFAPPYLFFASNNISLL